MKGLNALDDQGITLENAREAFRRHSGRLWNNRAKLADRIMREIVARREEIASTVSSETGKTLSESMLSDIIPTLETLRYLKFNADRVLRNKPAKTPMIFQKCRSFVQYKPRGVVLIISPWNNPFQLSVIPIMTALAAGNAVILKPSEKTPQTALLIQDIFRKAELAEGLLQVVTGGGEAAKALIEAAPDMIFFTGSVRIGMAVLSQASRKFIPVILELGGKDPMIIFDDANLERASGAALYGAFAHAGQHCVSVKRLFIQKSAFPGFISQFSEKVRSLAATRDWGKAMDPRAIESAKKQIAEALQKGASLLTPEDVEKAGIVPTVLLNCAPEMAVMREETFAPVLPIMTFDAEDDGVRLANDSLFGLNASVWTQDERRAERVARQLMTGNLFINNVLINIGNPSLPFGGVKSSGMGEYHGEEGLKAFCVKTSVMVSENRKPDEPFWFPHSPKKMNIVDDLILLRYENLRLSKRLITWIDFLKKTIGKKGE